MQEYRAFRAARVHDGVHDVPFWGTVDQVACCYICNKDSNCQPCCNLCVRFVQANQARLVKYQPVVQDSVLSITTRQRQARKKMLGRH